MEGCIALQDEKCTIFLLDFELFGALTGICYSSEVFMLLGFGFFAVCIVELDVNRQLVSLQE
ncbi:hypothetical protein SADUNF_Sadunf12G0015200 [Salix dunnii]|uniref:Uncharacterized protein n=1 Tax=Salix dunnii TaxID=1413687 RepID=A0A835JK06_9ROSI|nr:hypothetical protein SADUNF_Sadunf12G0015200 [Salix dunnii]